MVDFDVLLVVENWEGILGSDMVTRCLIHAVYGKAYGSFTYKLDQEIQIPRFG